MRTFQGVGTEKDNTPDHKRALVVGGSGGIGRAVSLRLCELGIDVVATGAHRSKVDQLQEAARSRSGGVTGVVVEARRAEDVLGALSNTTDVDIVVCALGPVHYGRLATTDDTTWRQLTELNLLLPAALARRYMPGMIRRGGGRFLFFGGTVGDPLVGYREIGAYAAVKAGLLALVRSLALEVEGTGVAVSAVCPDYVDTEYLTTEQRREFARRRRRRTGKEVLQKPQEIAETACYLITAVDDRHNGAIIQTDEVRIGKNGDVVPLFDK